MYSQTEASADLWQFACSIYRSPGVENACLDLQQREGWNIPLLLFVLWSTRFGELDAVQIHQAKTLAKDYADACIVSLRELRSRLKSSHLLEDDAALRELREQIKALELEAERLLLNRLAMLANIAQIPVSAEAEQLEQQVVSFFGIAAGAQKNVRLILNAACR